MLLDFPGDHSLSTLKTENIIGAARSMRNINTTMAKADAAPIIGEIQVSGPATFSEFTGSIGPYFLYITLQIFPFWLSPTYNDPSGPSATPSGRATALLGSVIAPPLNPSANTS